MKKLQAIFIGTLLTISVSANAVIVDNGQFTTDTDANLDWLDLGFTTSKSYFNTQTLLSGDSKLSSLPGFSAATTEKWAFATSSQLDTLIFNFTGLNVNGVNNSTNPNLLDGLINMLGKTYTSPTSPSTIYGSSGMIEGISVQGNLVTVKSFDRYLSNAGQDLPQISTSFLSDGNAKTSSVGVFLVRTSQYVLPSTVTSVTEPETYAMFIFGIGLLGLATRRKV